MLQIIHPSIDPFYLPLLSPSPPQALLQLLVPHQAIVSPAWKVYAKTNHHPASIEVSRIISLWEEGGGGLLLLVENRHGA